MNQLATIDLELVALVTFGMMIEFLRIFQLKQGKRKVSFIWTMIIYGVFILTALIDPDKHHPLRLIILDTATVLLFGCPPESQKNSNRVPTGQDCHSFPQVVSSMT